MLLWFLGLGFVLVALVFQSPALDYRLVLLGTVLPLVEVPLGRTLVLHSLLTPVVVLAVVMVGLRGRRLAQRRWLGLPIGLFVHLVLDGAWADTEAFWWPVTGLALPSGDPPELARGGWSLVMEVVGAAALVWAWRRFGLDDPVRRRRFWRTGQLDRALLG